VELLVFCCAVCDKERVSWHDNNGACIDRRSGAHVPESRGWWHGVDDDDPRDHAHTLLGEGRQQPQRHKQPVAGNGLIRFLL